jgi:dTDP-4-amino-4,6-dideoxygalactose transaminase
MGEIRSLCERRDAFILEDAAQAMGAKQVQYLDQDQNWTMAGVLGNAAAFSFFPTKNLGGFGDGGMVTTADQEFAERIAKLRVHGGKQMYHHEMVGTNSRLDALQAAALRVKLPHLTRWAEARRRNAAMYDELIGDLEGVRTPLVAPGNFHVYNQYTLRVHQRDELRSFLAEKEIGTGLYYPLGLHLQECFASLGGKVGDLPVTEALTKEVVSLPIFPELTEGQVSEVGEAIREFYSG